MSELITNWYFEYPIARDPKLLELQRLAHIELGLSNDELENVKEIIGYAHRLFTHNGDNIPTSADPLTILKEAKAGKSFRCVEYSTLAAGLLWANDIPARTIGIKTSDVETRQYGAGHVVIEFWSTQFSKWVMSDVQAGIIPISEEVPLSAYELAQKVNENDEIIYSPVIGARFSGNGSYDDQPSYTEWIKEYLCFIDTPIQLTLGNEDRRQQQIIMLVPDDKTPPKKFQGMFVMNALYTRNVSNFYAKARKL
jgi:hypothetical protein